eukprot:11159864-Lingulodinium_polyedra.AAC.1
MRSNEVAQQYKTTRRNDEARALPATPPKASIRARRAQTAGAKHKLYERTTHRQRHVPQRAVRAARVPAHAAALAPGPDRARVASGVT